MMIASPVAGAITVLPSPCLTAPTILIERNAVTAQPLSVTQTSDQWNLRVYDYYGHSTYGNNSNKMQPEIVDMVRG